MIWQLVKRDPAWRMALTFVPVAAVAALALPRGLIGMFGWLVCMPWLQCQPALRATQFQAGLPIRASDLFLTRILSFLALLWLPVATGAVMFLLRGRPVEDALIAMGVGAGMSVVVLAVLSSRPREIAGSQWAPAAAFAVVCAAGWPIVHFVPAAAVLAVCAALCAVLFWNIWRQLPPSFEVLPVQLARRAASQGDTAAPAFVWWPILRSLFVPGTLAFLPLVAMMTLSGKWLSVSVFCVFPVLTVLPRMPWALGLPVRRGALLAVILLPWVMTPLLGVLAGNWFGGRPPIRLEWSAANRISEVRPPLEFWRTGKAPVIVSPWGESWQPPTERLLGVEIYNPYSFGPGSSPRFFEWQFRRATMAVYGEEMDYADYKHLPPGVRPLMRQARLTILNLSACVACVMLLFNLVFTSMHWRAGRLSQHGQAVLSAVLMAQLALFFLIDLAPESHPTGQISVSLMNALLLRVSAMMPAGLPAVALAAVLPVALLCWTAVRLFDGVELPPPAAARS